MVKNELSSSSLLDRIRDNKSLRTIISIGAVSFVAACGPQEANSTPPNVAQSQEATPSPTESSQTPEQISASGAEAIKKIATYSIKDAEKIVGKKLEKTTAYLEGNTDILQGTQFAYYNSEVYSTREYDQNKSGLENGLQDAIATELLVYLTGTPEQMQELLERKQLSLQDVVYIYETYEKLIPKLQLIEQEAGESTSPELTITEAPMIHGIVAKSGTSLLAISRIAEFYQQGKITLLDSETCEYDASKNYTNETFKLNSGDGFIVIDPLNDPSSAPFFDTDRFNPYYLNITSVGTFGIIQTERAMSCEGSILKASKKMLLPYYSQAAALKALATTDFRSANYPQLTKIQYTMFNDVLKVTDDDYITANTFKENF